MRANPECIGSGLRDHVEHAAAGAAELYAEISGLNGYFLDRIGDVERLSRASKCDVVVIGSIQKIVVSAYPLAINRELGSFTFSRQSQLPVGWITPGSVRANEIGLRLIKGRSRASLAKKFPPLNGLSFTRSSVAAVTSTFAAMDRFRGLH